MRSRWATLLVLLIGSAAVHAQYQPALPGYHFEFPRDYFNHSEYETEWWYYTGNLKASDGHRFGFELTFFRQGVNRNAALGTWSVHDVYFAHFALSDLDGGHFYPSERFNRQGPGIAGASLGQRRVWNGNWQVKWEADGQRLSGLADQFGIDLTLVSRKPPVVHGQNGVSQKAAGKGQASHYISLTHLRAQGSVALNGKSYAVDGTAWMDHEFSSNSLGTDEVGWDWLSLQFDDDTEVMLYRLRHKDGSADPFSSGTYVDAEGHSFHLVLHDFTMRPAGGIWTSPVTGGRYPTVWDVAIPRYEIEVQIRSPLLSQELSGRAMISPSYWEGAITLAGQRGHQPIHGVGYLEMTGYDRPVPLSEPLH